MCCPIEQAVLKLSTVPETRNQLVVKWRFYQNQQLPNASTNFLICAVSRPLSAKNGRNVDVFTSSIILNGNFFFTVLSSSLPHFVLFPGFLALQSSLQYFVFYSFYKTLFIYDLYDLLKCISTLTL